jgi:hypothetical protein
MGRPVKDDHLRSSLGLSNCIHAVMPLDVLGRTRATLMDSSSFLP